jgi:kynurenine formamidase
MQTQSTQDEAARWWPSAFGPDDQIGMLNHIDDAKRAAALSLVRTGRMYDLAHVLDENVPVFPGRHFRQTLVTTAHHQNGGGVGDNCVNWTICVASATEQLGTHLDGLNHLQIGERTYNGHTISDLAESWGTNRLGAETIPQIVTRGFLVDVSELGLGPGDVIDVEHLNGLEPEPGDAVLFHTGWSRHWEDPDAFLAGEPGPGMELAGWLADRGVALTGCDTWSYGPVPPEDPSRPFEVPQTLNVRHGVFVVECLRTEELAADGVREFALILTHPKLRGASGAWTAPIALV